MIIIIILETVLTIEYRDADWTYFLNILSLLHFVGLSTFDIRSIQSSQNFKNTIRRTFYFWYQDIISLETGLTIYYIQNYETDVVL